MSVAQPRHTTKQPSISRESTNCEITADCFPGYAASAAGNLTPTWVSAISAFGNVATELSHRSFKFGLIRDFVESGLLIDNKSQQPRLVDGGNMTPAKPRSATHTGVTISGSMIAATPMPNCERATAMQYSPEWDLSSIPERVFASERARRVAAKRKKFGAVKLAPCKDCGRLINARQRRYPCPYHVAPPSADDPTRVRKSRDEVILALALAIAEVGHQGPGKWHAEKTGRRDITLSYTADQKALRGTGLSVSKLEDAMIGKVWARYGGPKILAHAVLPVPDMIAAIHRIMDGTISFYVIIPCGG